MTIIWLQISEICITIIYYGHASNKLQIACWIMIIWLKIWEEIQLATFPYTVMQTKINCVAIFNIGYNIVKYHTAMTSDMGLTFTWQSINQQPLEHFLGQRKKAPKTSRNSLSLKLCMTHQDFSNTWGSQRLSIDWETNEWTSSQPLFNE